MSSVRIIAKTEHVKGKINLPLSKSISNRALMISAISGGKVKPGELSEADDSVLLQQLLKQIKEAKDPNLNTRNAGTVYRFLTAYLAVTSGQWILDGDERMRQRPVQPLVDALHDLGAEITYLGEDGFPPLQITGKTLNGGKVFMQAGYSSQHISALMMVAPLFKEGLSIGILKQAVSVPYIEMTASMMTSAGAEVEMELPYIRISGNYKAATLPFEYDWSAAAFWYELLALSKGGELLLKGLKEESLQGDRVLESYFVSLGVETDFNDEGALIRKGFFINQHANFQLSDYPDLVPVCAVTAAGKGFDGMFIGVAGLKYKETDRLQALAQELGKAGITCTVSEDEIIFKAQRMEISEPFETYNDHRMAMAFAPLAILGQPVTVNNPEVVSKSYPGFWEELSKILDVEF